jgi:hypothetical protein
MTSVKGKQYKTHQIICTVFHGPPPDKHHTSVDHIDNDPLNNKPENLRWATPKMQADNTHSKAIVAYNKDGSEAGRWVSAADAARELGGASTNISACLRGKTKTCRGFTWKYQ